MMQPTIRRSLFVRAAGLAALLLVACGGAGDGGASANSIDNTGGGGGSGGSAGQGGGSGTAMGGVAGKAGSAGASIIGGSGGGGGKAGSGGAAGSGGSAGKGICLPDDDMDTLSNDVEGKGMSPPPDTDGDGIPDYLDTDSDGDTIPDEIEGDTKDVGCMSPEDSDGDKTPDFRDLDSDNNGLPDRKEVTPDGAAYDPTKGVSDVNQNGRPDYADTDNDGDSLHDTDELLASTGVMMDANGSPDADGDGIPDLDDIDSDGDVITDNFEGQGDFDKDGVPNRRDQDSDGDGVPDACEGGLTAPPSLTAKPADHDQDGKYDFLDLDSDNDGIPDAQEDPNGNCIVDPGETDRTRSDTDGDGAPDLVEVTLGTDPQDINDFPALHGQYWFILPYEGPNATGPCTPQSCIPMDETVPVSTALQKVDFGFLLDTTGSMAGEEMDLKAGLSSIASAAQQLIPDVAVGIAAHDDVPISPYGSAALGDNPIYIPKGGTVSTMPGNYTAAIQSLGIHDGGDLPEAQVMAMWRLITNGTLYWPGTIEQPDTGVPPDRFGAFQYRSDALNLMISVTDAPFHNGRRVNVPGVLHDPYSFNTSGPYPVPTVDDLVQAMNAQGMRFIGFAADDGNRAGDPYLDMAYLTDQTGSLVLPSAFGNNSVCLTGIGGNALPAPDGPNNTCRAVFDVYKNGQGLSTRVVDGITAVLKTILLDIHIEATSADPTTQNGIDTVDTFLDHIDVIHMGGQDIADPTQPCVTLLPQNVLDELNGPKGVDPCGPQFMVQCDGYDDTVLHVVPTTKICFDAAPIVNTTVPATDKVQVFAATLQVKAKKTSTQNIDYGAPKQLIILVPPAAQ